MSNDIFNGNYDYPLRLPEFPYTAASLFDSRYDSITYGLTWVSESEAAEIFNRCDSIITYTST